MRMRRKPFRTVVALLAGAAALVGGAALPSSPAQAAVGEQEQIYAYWAENGVRAWNIDVNTTVVTASDSKFVSHVFDFDTGGGGYFGLQQRTDGGRQAIFSLWRNGIFGAAAVTSTGAAGCSTHGENGGGIKCVLPLAWSTGVTYKLRLWRLATSTTGDTWGAWVIDTRNGTERQIATIRMGRPAAVASTVRDMSSFLEDFTNIDDCVPPLLFAVDLQRPTFNAGASVATYESTNGGSACARGAVQDVSSPTVPTKRLSLGSQPIRLAIESDGRCLTVPGLTPANGVGLLLAVCNGSAQQSFTQQRDGTLRGFGGKCLDVRGPSTANGTVVQTWDCVGVSNQQWTLRSDRTIRGYVGKCMGPLNDGRIVMWDCNAAVPWHRWNRL